MTDVVPLKVFKGSLNRVLQDICFWAGANPNGSEETKDLSSYWCVRQSILERKGFDVMDYFETDGSYFEVFDVPGTNWEGREVVGHWVVFEVYDEEVTKASLRGLALKSDEDIRLTWTKEQLERVDAILDRLLSLDPKRVR